MENAYYKSFFHHEVKYYYKNVKIFNKSWKIIIEPLFKLKMLPNNRFSSKNLLKSTYFNKSIKTNYL